MKKIRSLINNSSVVYIILGIVILAGLYLRISRPDVLFNYSHDSDLASWIIKNIVVDGHTRLIGQLTSTMGIYIGSFFYYFLVPFYLLFKMDPIGAVYAGGFLGLVTIFSSYYIFSKLYDKQTGLIAAFITSVSFFIVLNDREIVPTSPVILWSLWFYYGINLLVKGRQHSLILLGFLASLIWHLNLALVLALPLIPLALILSKEKVNLKFLIGGIVTLIVFSLPLILFELRHDFIQVKFLQSALITRQSEVIHGFYKFEKVIISLDKNIKTFLFGNLTISSFLSLVIVSVSVSLVALKKWVSREVMILSLVWIVLFVGFFTWYSKILSEYYLNGLFAIWIAAISIVISKFVSSKGKLRLVGIVLFFSYLSVHWYSFVSHDVNTSGYSQKTAIIDYINQDRLNHQYPCVSLSFITDPGYELGYRYLIWREEMPVLKPASQSPVYTIVYPHTKVNLDEIDETFGALGLILPDYNRYTKDEIEKSCLKTAEFALDPILGYSD